MWRIKRFGRLRGSMHINENLLYVQVEGYMQFVFDVAMHVRMFACIAGFSVCM